MAKLKPSFGKGPRRNSLGWCWRVGRWSAQGVVPFAVEVVAGDREGVDLFVGVFDADGVGPGVEFGADGEPGGGAGGADQVDDDLVAGQGPVRGRPRLFRVIWENSRCSICSICWCPVVGGIR